MDFFSTTESLRGYSGDTFPAFGILTDAQDLTGCTMRLVLEDVSAPGSVAFSKSCTRKDKGGRLGYSVQLGSSETAQLCGTYTMHFILTDAENAEHRKLVGTLIVLRSPAEVIV